MRKFFMFSLVGLLLSGCAFSTTMVMDTNGKVTGTAVFGVPKSALPKITSVEQWAQVLSDNNFPSPTPSASTSESPQPDASCNPAEDAVRGLWTYACDFSGDVSAITSASETANTSNMSFVRNGKELTVSLSGSGDSDNPFGIGLKGISLISLTTSLTLPGKVTNFSDGVIATLGGDTVKFETDESQKTTLTATYELTDPPMNQVNVSMNTKPSFNALTGTTSNTITATLPTPIPGNLEVFDGSKSLGVQTLTGDATQVTFIQDDLTSGEHNYRLVFMPSNWWEYDQSSTNTKIIYSSFTMVTRPKITGVNKVGSTLSAAPGTWNPSATSVTYQWLRNGKNISGATKRTYKTVNIDRGKSISVRVVASKAGALSKAGTSTAVKINN